MSNWESKNILGVKVDKTNYDEVIEWISGEIEKQGKIWVATPNPEIVLKAQENSEYEEILNRANLRIADGVGLSIAAKYLDKLGKRKYQSGLIGRLILWKLTIWEFLVDRNSVEKYLPQVSGDVLVRKLIEEARNRQWKVFLLGGRMGNSQKAAEKLKQELGIKVEHHPGAKEIRKETEREREEVIEQINAFKPDILLVAYGAPWQEMWIGRNLENLKTHIAIGVGGTVDDLAEGKETPTWMREKGLRWLWRLWKEPARLGRIWDAVVVFGWRVVRD